MPTLVSLLDGEQLLVRLLKAQEKKKLCLEDYRGRQSSIAPDKVVFHHQAASIPELEERLNSLAADIDVPLLWETARAESTEPWDMRDLARLYFESDSDDHVAAVFRALVAERLHFRRKGRLFEPRSNDELDLLREQRAAVERAENEQARLQDRLQRGEVSTDLSRRLLAFLRGGDDKLLARALDTIFNDPAREAFELLERLGVLPATASLEVLQANVQADHPPAVLAHAAALQLVPNRPEVRAAGFSIDDEETREVDDVLSIHQEGPLLRVDIDIADPAALVLPGDPVDREALRRATTIYLPTGIFYLLPERIGCQLCTLQAGEPRPALRTSVWLDEDGQVAGHELSRITIRVGERLDYAQADQLLGSGQGPTATRLRLLQGVAEKLAARRRKAGALFLQRREWKVRVTEGGGVITIKRIEPDSPSRRLVAEMMILTGRLAAEEASSKGLPIIYRVQPAPIEPLPDLLPGHPAAFEQLRRFIQPATLSLSPAPHWGLGLDAYTQVTSPLRRYADLVVQRQLISAMEGHGSLYAQEDLLRVLAAAESTEKEAKRIEAAVSERWRLEYMDRLPVKDGLEALVLGEHPGGGYRVELDCCGALGVLLDDRRHEPGTSLLVNVKTVRPRRGVLRLLPSS